MRTKVWNSEQIDQLGETSQLLYMDTNSFILSEITKDKIKDLNNLEDIIDFSDLDENHEIISNKNKKSNRQN